MKRLRYELRGPKYGLGCPMMFKGNRMAARENISAEANARRDRNALLGVATCMKKANKEIEVTPNMEVKRQKRERFKLQKTIARSHRETQDKAKQMVDAVLERLFDIATTSYNETAAIAAGTQILDRAHGKANQTSIHASVDANGDAKSISSTELNTRIEAALNRVKDLTGGEAEAPKSEAKPPDLREHDRDPDSTTKH